MATTESTEKTKLHECLKHASGTDIGKKRTENQDRYGEVIADNYKFFVVADGMGGVEGGALAAQTTVDIIKSKCGNLDKITSREIVSAIGEANETIFQLSLTGGHTSGMGTTLVGLCYTDNRVYIVNVGDSRAYRIRSGKTMQLTVDHTLVNELLKAGLITESQVKDHPVSHMLTRSLGPSAVVEIDCFLDEPGPIENDIYLLCSDGLYNLVSDQEIGRIVSENTLEDAVKKLTDLANKRGGVDNITITLIKVENGGFEISNSNIEEDISITQSGFNFEQYSDGADEAFEKVIVRSSSEYLPSTHFTSKKTGYQKFREIITQTAGVFGVICAAYLIMSVAFKDSKSLDANLSFSKIDNSQNLTRNNSSTIAADKEIKPTQKSSEERERGLQQLIDRNKDILVSFSDPDKRGELLERIPGIMKTISENQKIVTNSAIEIDNETKNLSIWIERKGRLENIGSLGLSSELSEVSEEVASKLKNFQEATWNYLQLAEKNRQSKSNPEIQAEIKKALTIRKDAMNGLELSVFTTTQKNIDSINKNISNLIITKSKAQEIIKSNEADLNILKSLSSKDENKVASTKRELKDKLEAYYYELTSLRQLDDLID